VREELEDDIVNGRLAPGVQVDVEQLMARRSRGRLWIPSRTGI